MSRAYRSPRRDDVEAHDCSMRWLVKSRRTKEKYLVDLAAYDGNGRCSCTDFEIHMEPILRHGQNPADAVAAGVLKLRPYHAGPWAACQCYHIFRAREALTDAFIEKIRATEAAQRSAAGRQ